MLPRERILALTGASAIEVGRRVQSLWSGYGEIVRVYLDGAPAIVKHVNPPQAGNHPRGWNTDRSHDRKLHSYAVELAWYRNWSARCGAACRVPQTLAAAELDGGGWLFVLEDLDAAGFPLRRGRLDRAGITLCLNWLAAFHATFLAEKPEGLWDVGTYWHLATRRDELDAMHDGKLKDAAAAIDAKLRSARYQTFVHGDAKVANFCFAPDGASVAAVDFQYVGGGCGMKDVAYLLGSCTDERECERSESIYLDIYFTALRRALTIKPPEIKPPEIKPPEIKPPELQRPQIDARELEREWRQLFPVAWTDFYRFLAGWSPGHPKMTSYSERLAHEVVAALAR